MGLTGEENYEIVGLTESIKPMEKLTVRARRRRWDEERVYGGLPDRYAGGIGVLPKWGDFADGFEEVVGGEIGERGKSWTRRT